MNNRKIPRELKITEQSERNLNLFEIAEEGTESIKQQKEKKTRFEKNTDQAHYKTNIVLKNLLNIITEFSNTYRKYILNEQFIS